MCGVLGFIGELSKGDTKRLCKVFSALSIRGVDASGWAMVSDNDNYLHYWKSAQSSSVARHALYKEIRNKKSSAGILHARFTTQGSELISKNNHPFIYTLFDGSVLSLVHNGMIHNYKEVLKKDAELKESITKDGIETDSFIVLAAIARRTFKDRSVNLEKQIPEELKRFSGSITLLFLHKKKNKDQLFYIKHDNPLVVYKHKTNNGFLFCSTREILTAGFNLLDYFLVPAIEDMLYFVDLHTRTVKEIANVNFENTFSFSTPSYYTYGGNNYHQLEWSGDDGQYCACCGNFHYGDSTFFDKSVCNSCKEALNEVVFKVKAIETKREAWYNG